MVLDGAQGAALAGTVAAWGHFAASALVTVAVAIAMTGYIARPIHHPAEDPATTRVDAA
jgi:hypothetical protein